MKDGWFSWATAIAALLAALILLVQVFLTHRGQERAAAAHIRRDLMDLTQAASVLERRLESGLRHYQAVACGAAEVEVRLTDGRREKRSLRGVMEVQTNLIALGAATSRASPGEALDGVAFASGRLTGELSLLQFVREPLERHVRETFHVERVVESGESSSEQRGGQADGADGPSGPGGEAGDGEDGCKRPPESAPPEIGEAKAVIEFLRAVAQHLATQPDCELVALSRTNLVQSEAGREGLGLLVRKLDVDGESGQTEGETLWSSFEKIEWDSAREP